MNLNLYIIDVVVVILIIIQIVFFRKMKSTISEIKSIKAKIVKYNNIQVESKGYRFEKDCYINQFNYLAIGNSITLHEACDYWWSEYGMAASTKDSDFFHRTITGFEKIYGGGKCLCC